ncbi:hypothetical protein GCM10011584_14790 [Nocardioides phosphati]|uniref:Sulfotransferase family protein n=1 Tax=Nocardioides phosphati TaxID=1867775 RepID=A0ABQ2N9D9_9ACTN|nr:hypothetical protein [Nocardioides phosphati]GGO88255.1 hypothetical protein GCM10011584_14790 [Nocardioides phosphati]
MTDPATQGPIYLHVGTPKTGTSYLQDVLFGNRDGLAKQGLLYPAERFDGQFLAALDLMRLPWGGLEKEAVGAWDDLARKVRAWDGPVIISHEILATAKPADVKRALKSLGHPDREVRILVSVRDLARQIPAEWQENVKHRRTLRYKRFLEQIQDPERPGGVAPWFWDAQDVPAILGRWAADLPADRVTLITVPPPGADRDLLWQRFAEAFDLADYKFDLHTERANPSMGVPETALLRRVNRAATKVVPPKHYRVLVRELLAHQTLALRTESPRLGVPQAVWEWADSLARGWVATLQERGYRVVGDLADLTPAPAEGEYADPDRPRERQVAFAAVEALTALLVEASRLREVEEELRAELAEARAALDKAELPFKERTKVRAYTYASGRPWGRRAIAAYKKRQGL